MWHAAGAVLVFVGLLLTLMTQLARLRLYASKGMKITPILWGICFFLQKHVKEKTPKQ